LSYIAPKKVAETEYSNRNNSKPEIDFVAVPTAFKNVRRGLKMPMKVCRQGALEGVELEKWASAQNFQSPK